MHKIYVQRRIKFLLIFGSSTKSEKIKAIMDYNSVVGRTVYNINSDSSDSNIATALTAINSKRNDVYTYYEYVQFKRAKFDCDNSKIDYDKKTGRIIKMEFKFTGKFE